MALAPAFVQPAFAQEQDPNQTVAPLVQEEAPSTDGEQSGEAAKPQQPGQDIAESLDPKATSPDPVSQNWAKADFAGFIDIRQRLQPPRQELLDKGLRVVTSDDYPPFNSRDSNGRPYGYHVELVKFFCEELNIACTLKIVPFADIPQLLADGKADMALAGLANRPSLREK
ncbi:MAG: transporter substrate-binding domain-containing protein, partial [Porticoccaceae bacterium]|nr:transporter substrate-binding domain-containing protein [Porticoccaceae bacterium]